MLIINGEEVKDIAEVTEEDKIEYKFEKNEAIRNVDITTTSDKMEAYITIKYVPTHTYELVNQEYHKNIFID